MSIFEKNIFNTPSSNPFYSDRSKVGRVDSLLGAVEQKDKDRSLDLQNQIDNYKLRLTTTGFDADDIADPRNILEKALNLPKKQKWYFDILEIIDRPKRAILGAIQENTHEERVQELTGAQLGVMTADKKAEYYKAKQGDSRTGVEKTIDGFLQGLAGHNKDRYTGRQVLGDIFHEGEQGGLGTAAAGFLLEMAVDPTNWLLFKAKPSVSGAKAATGMKPGAEAASKTAEAIVKSGGKSAAVDVSKEMATKAIRDTAISSANVTQALGGKAYSALKGGQAHSVIEQAKQLTEVLDATATAAKASKLPQGAQEIFKFLSGTPVTGRMAQIRAAQTPWEVTKQLAGGSVEVAGRIFNPHWYLTTAKYNAEHVTAINKLMSGSVGMAKRLGSSGLDWTKNKYMQRVAALTKTNPELALKKARNYLDVEDSFNSLMQRTQQFVSRRRGFSKAQTEIVKGESNGLFSNYLDASELETMNIANMTKHDYNPKLMQELGSDPVKLQRAVFHAKEAQLNGLTWTIDEFVNEISASRGTGKGMPYSKELADGLLGLTKNNPDKYGIRFISDGAEVALDKLDLYKPSIMFNEDIWNKQNANRLINDFMRLNPMDSQRAIGAINGTVTPWELKATVEAPSWVQDMINNMDSKESLQPFKRLVDNYSETYDSIIKLQGEAFFNDSDKMLALTKQKYGEGFVSRHVGLEGNRIKDYINELEALSGGPKPDDFASMTLREQLFEDTTDLIETALRQEQSIEKIVGDSLKGKENLIGGISGEGNLKHLRPRNIAGTTHSANIYMKDYMLDVYNDMEYFTKRFPNATDVQHSELIDLIKSGDWFDTRADHSLRHLADDVSEALAKSSLMVEIGLAESFDRVRGKYHGIKAIDPGQRIPVNLVKFEYDDASQFLNSLNIAGQYSDSEAVMEMSDLIRKAMYNKTPLYVDKSLHRHIAKTTKVSADVLIQNMNHYTNQWKKLKVTSPAYQARNVKGNIFNAAISGQNFGDVLTGIDDARKTMKNLGSFETGEGILGKVAAGSKLSASELADYEMWKDMRRAGFLDDDFIYRLRDIEKPGMEVLEQWPQHKEPRFFGKMFDKASDINMKLNQTFDDWTRVSTYNYAKNNPAYMAALGVNTPVEAVRMVHFDVSNLTDLEADIIRKIVPFYNFNRQNIAFQFKNILNNPNRIKNFVKGFEAVWDFHDVSAEDLADYERDSFYLPIPFRKKQEDGTYDIMKSNLTLSEAVNFLDNPFDAAMSSLNPLIRMPFELAMNKDTFTKRPIRDTREQTKNYIMSMLGIDVPLRMPAGAKDAVIGAANKDLDAFYDGLRKASSLFGVSDTNKRDIDRQYEELDKLKAFIKMMEEQGQGVPTVTELRRWGVLPKK